MDGDTYSASSPSGQHPRGALGVLSSDVANLASPGARKERAHRGLSLDAHTTGQDTTAYNRTTKLPVSSRRNHMGLRRHSAFACAAYRRIVFPRQPRHLSRRISPYLAAPRRAPRRASLHLVAPRCTSLHLAASRCTSLHLAASRRIPPHISCLWPPEMGEGARVPREARPIRAADLR